MAIDHVRDMLGAARFNPTDLTQTTPALFFTRWITHLCAPAFIFLAGAGAFLSRSRAVGSHASFSRAGSGSSSSS